MISRRRFFEKMSQPYSLALYHERPLFKLCSVMQAADVLIFSEDTLITTAAKQCLQRSSELMYEPIVVKCNHDIYRLLDVHLLLIAQGIIQENTGKQLDDACQEIRQLNESLKSKVDRMSAELEVTRRLQQMLLPKSEELESITELEISGFMQSADEVGGDYYDVLSHKGSLKIGIGDITGHGLESGVLMLMVQTAVRTLLISGIKDSTKFLSILNSVIYENIQRMGSDKSLTLSLLDYKQNNLLLSGQHEEVVVVVRRGGVIELIDTMDLGFPIGLDEDIEPFVAQTDVRLESGDVVVLYTDGITEAENSSGAQYGLEKMCQVISHNCHASAEEIKQAVIADVRQHIGEHTVFDDITVVVLKKR
ncbi:MAG: SpoIIE family protein phosphatase [Scytonema sp. CRU_2_7]|nr:SpoIIE family protein phosphatase [Scytonema sp. CRU_2_7]